MIAKVVRGYRPGLLVAYLFGPGQFEEHRNPRLVASWDGAPFLHQPPRLPGAELDGEVVEAGEFDLDLRQLIATLTDPARAAGLPMRKPPALPAELAQRLRSGLGLGPEAPSWARRYKLDPRSGKVVLRQGYVWHCPVRLAPGDRILTDAQWQHIAERLMRATGIHQAGCRWIAVRHADDHIHLMATLVSEHTGREYEPYRDYLRLRAECRRLEREFGLTTTAPADRTAAPAPTRAERAKADRRGRTTTPRELLRQRVTHAAATTRDPEQFLAALRHAGLDPSLRLDAHGRPVGYTVALPGDRTSDGHLVRYAGKALAPDLTWPKLAARWHTVPPPPDSHPARSPRKLLPAAARRALLTGTTTLVDRAAAGVRAGTEDIDGVAHATGEVLTALGRVSDGSSAGELNTAAGRYDRAARMPYRVVPTPLGPLAADLRLAARQLGTISRLSERGQERLALTALLLALGGLIVELAAWQHDQHRPHQAAAAQTTAAALQTSQSRQNLPRQDRLPTLEAQQGHPIDARPAWDAHRPRPPDRGAGRRPR